MPFPQYSVSNYPTLGSQSYESFLREYRSSMRYIPYSTPRFHHGSAYVAHDTRSVLASSYDHMLQLCYTRHRLTQVDCYATVFNTLGK